MTSTTLTPLSRRTDVGSLTRARDQRDATRRARTAFDTRIEQLEHEHAALMRTLVNVEKAVKWLPESQRVRARARLRRLGLDQQLDAFAGLHDVIDGSAAA